MPAHPHPPQSRDAYVIVPRAAYDPHLCELSKNLITSFVYSHDLVSRLSLGALRDMSRAAVWLCKAEAEGRPEGYTGITRRALRHKMGFGSRDDPIWVRHSQQIFVLRCISAQRSTCPPSSSCPSARRSRRTCRYITSTRLGASCGPCATRTCRTLRHHLQRDVTARWRHCALSGRRMASVCLRCWTSRRCSRKLSLRAT